MHLAEIFIDHMVLQRDQKICVFGFGQGIGEIEFCGKKYAFTSCSENFRVYLDPQNAGGPYEMRVTLNENTQIIKDILIGDVYIASGQSNMEMMLCDTQNVEYFSNDNIRFFTEPNTADEDGNLLCYNAEWRLCQGKNIDKFSAIGYYFANELQKNIAVPVGIISCSKGASRVDAWTSPDIVKQADYQKMISIKHNDYHVYKFNHNSWLYENKLLNIVPFANSGVLWYQGESNRGTEEGKYYTKLLEIMIKNWRELWQYNMPFYCVQLMPYNESSDVADWAMIRSQQELASKTIDNVYLVTLFNTGESDEIHPTKKKNVAYALANAVRKVQFNESIEYSGPVLKEFNRIKNVVELTFTHAEGLSINGDNLCDTYVYDINDKLLKFDILIQKNILKIICEDNNIPNLVTMGYNNAPEHNLYNSSGYLASPFKIELN